MPSVCIQYVYTSYESFGCSILCMIGMLLTVWATHW